MMDALEQARREAAAFGAVIQNWTESDLLYPGN